MKQRVIEPSQVWVVIPAYGLVSMTQDLVAALFQQSSDPTVLIVDNGGDYVSVGAERVVRPATNLGWLRGTNFGTKVALDSGARAVVWLNNDTDVSPDFVKNLCNATHGSVGIVAPVYDQNVPEQRRGYFGPAKSYQPVELDHLVTSADGTALLVTADVVDAIGFLDEKSFASHGWGAIEDYAMRLADAGFTFVVTERAYINHHGCRTARTVNGEYQGAAYAEMWLGMRRKYGRNWQGLFPDREFAPDKPLPYLRHRTLLAAYNLSGRTRKPNADLS